MTEKQYGGATGRGTKEIKVIQKTKQTAKLSDERKKDKMSSEENKQQIDKEKILLAGKIASQVKFYAKNFIKKDMPLLEIAEKIEEKILELGGKPAFPVNLSINNISAHYTPSHDDKNSAHGLMKIDFGVHIDGWTADNAFSIDLENNEENKKLIIASQDALNNALKLIKSSAGAGERGDDRGKSINEISLNEIGTKISEIIESYNFNPIINLSGHSMEQYSLHSGITIPNIDNKDTRKLKTGLYAIEPFATNGSGKIREGKPSGIYELRNDKNIRNPIAREILEFIKEEYNTLPFCSRWIVKKIGTKALFGLKQLEENGNLHHYNQLVEISESKVSQAEETIFIDEDGNFIVTTI